jgi:signal-transduction protein with cAMP-binding, CBS, and nucleotidyltransferase domain
LQKLPNLDESRKDEIEKMYDFVMYMRISNQVHQILNNEAPENTRDLKSISRIEENTLKKILQEIVSLQVELNMDFKGFGE